MTDSTYFQDKLSQSKIRGLSKPFVDENLQLQLPPWDSSSQASFSNRIYSHYVGSSPSPSLFSQVNETEVHHAIEEAESSYQAWKAMQLKLVELLKKN